MIQATEYEAKQTVEMARESCIFISVTVKY